MQQSETFNWKIVPKDNKLTQPCSPKRSHLLVPFLQTRHSVLSGHGGGVATPTVALNLLAVFICEVMPRSLR